MANPLAAYSTLGNLGTRQANMGGELGFGMSKSIANERRAEEKKYEDREKKRGLGRLAGSSLGLLAGLFTGGMSIPLQMLIAGAASGGGSLLGQKAAGGDKKIKTGLWDIDEGEKANRYAKDSVWSSAGTDALTSAAFTGAGGLTKYLGKGAKLGQPMSDTAMTNSMTKISSGLPKYGGRLAQESSMNSLKNMSIAPNEFFREPFKPNLWQQAWR